MSERAYYSSTIETFLSHSSDYILGKIQKQHSQDINQLQTNAWLGQIEILQNELSSLQEGELFFELLIPRMGKRADIVILYNNIIFVFEFKVGEKKYLSSDVRQAHDYALDLSHFHEGSHSRVIIPVLVATQAKETNFQLSNSKDMVFKPLKTNNENILNLLEYCSSTLDNQPLLDYKNWFESSYKPTPSIIEAAQALYAEHEVEDISRHDAGAVNLNKTSKRLKEIIKDSRENYRKSICFVTGVPGAGKTLVGLNIADLSTSAKNENYSVFLSGNGPLVEVLREALVRDEVSRKVSKTKGEAKANIHPLIQNIHHFRDGALKDQRPPVEKVAIFDEAQRAWNKESASKFMRQKRNQPDFNQSEPDFLIEVMDRHKDWCVIVALIGGGQEINTGEAGLVGWFDVLDQKYKDWQIYYSDKIDQKEYVSGNALEIRTSKRHFIDESLHLKTSMRSFKAEKLSHMIHHVIHNSKSDSYELYQKFKDKFPVKITRNIQQAKSWLLEQSRANETKGIIASSGAIRLKPDGLFVKNALSPSNYFLNEESDIRSCHHLEDVATEFDIQGLELDWCCVCWDADYRYKEGKFEHFEFKGTKWNKCRKAEKQRYLENAYRVLLTRARQGMIIYIPTGDDNDMTRKKEFYNETYEYLLRCGLEPI